LEKSCHYLIEMPVLWKTALKFGTMYKDNRSYQSCTGSINAHSIGLSSLLYTGGKVAQRKEMLPSRSLELRKVIKAFATGSLGNETLPVVYHLAC